jgi:putative hydrolase of the HAD superfamily
MPDIQAVLFDYGLVLTAAPDATAWAEMKSILSATEDSFHAAYWAHRHDYDRGALTGSAYWHAVARDLSHTLTPAQLHALLEADTTLWTQPNPDTIAWAAALQRAGIKTGILSNIGDAMENGILSRLPWLHAFTHHTFSHRLGIAKPDLAIYAHAAAGLGVAPAQILFVDDREENIVAARDAGMTAIQYSTHQAFVRDMQAAGLAPLLNL